MYLYFLLDFLPGSIGGIVSRTLTNPIDRVKIIMQVNHSKMTMSHVLKRIIFNDGIVGLFRGNILNCLKVAPSNGIRYFSFNRYRDLISLYSDNMTLICYLSGGLTGLTSTILTYPLDFMRSTFSAKSSKEIPDVKYLVSTTYCNQGLRGFYKGCYIACLGIIPYTALNFGTYNWLKIKYGEHPLSSLWLGAASGTVAVILTYPTDVIKRRKMIEPDFIQIKPYIIKMIKNEGYRGFYRGLGACLVKVIPSNAIQWFTIDYVVKLINHYKNEK